MKRKIFTLLLCGFFGTAVMAQNVPGVVKKTTVKPVIDGKIDDVWATANKYDVDKPFRLELPTLGESGTTYWKGLWDADGFYILVVVNDDSWLPSWAPGGGANSYEYDKIELYFDTNPVLKDGVGGQGGTTGNRQIAPDTKAGILEGQPQTVQIAGFNVDWAILVEDPHWEVEYFVPWDAIPDKDGILFDKTATMGFDVNIADMDAGEAPPPRKRMMWSNVGAIDENWNNMDDAGHLTFEGAETAILIDKVTVTAGTVTVDNGTLQMVATIDPVDASNQKLRWSIVEGGTGKASIDATTGVLTAIADGTVTVKAAATDGGWSEGTADVTISGQKIDQNDIWNSLNKISKWNFNDGKTGDFPTGWSGWVDGGVADQVLPVIEDGIVAMKCGLASDGNNWHYQLNQSNLTCEPNVPYTLKFKSWASAAATPCAVDFEDTPTLGYTRYGSSSDAEAVSGGSEWHYSVGTDPTWITFHVVFDKLTPTSVQKIQWMNSLSTETVYLDSVLLIKDADLLLSAKELAANTMKVYPNPVGAFNELNVNLTSLNAKVAIYNSLGQKLMEKTANGNLAKFNVSSLRKGMYFVRLSDGTTQKFIK